MITINQKLIAKFPKDMIIQLVCGVYRINEVYIDKLYGTVNEDRCRNCPRRNLGYCDDCTDKYDLTRENVKDSALVSDEIQVCTKKQLSKKAILLYMAYYFCNIKQEGNDGVIAVVQERELSNLINCCMATIYNLNELLRDLGLIEYERIGSGLIRVVIKNYSVQFRKNRIVRRYDEDGNELKFYGGYINLTIDWFKKLIEVATTTNLVRLALFKTVKYDSYKANNLNKSDYTVEYYNRDYKKILTGELCNKEINELTLSLNELFNDKIKHDVINEFELKEEFVGNKVLAKFKSKCNGIFGKIFSTLTKENYEDLEKLSEQYGEETIQNMITYLIKNKSETHESILENLGLIRTAIKNQIEYQFIRLTRVKIFSNDTAAAFTM